MKEMIFINLINGDCITGMDKLIKRGVKVDMILTDPPYLMNYKTNGRKNKNHKFTDTIQNDNNPNIIIDAIKRCSLLLKDGGAFYCFCNDVKIDFFKQNIERYFTVKNILIWEKNNGTIGDLTGSYRKSAEFIIFATNGRHILNGKRDKDVLHFKRVPSNKLVHQNQKPLKLIKYLINKSSNPGDIILDCFMGSGTTGVACRHMRREFIGFEIDETYYKIANKRVNLGE